MKKVGLFVLSILIIGIFASFVSAETVGSSLINSIYSGTHINFGFLSIANPANATFLQFLIFALVALVIYGITPYLPFFEDNAWIRLGVTLIVAYLSTFAITPSELNALLVSYDALGIVITGIIPFFLIAAISKKAYENGKGIFVNKTLWVVFFFIMLYKFLYADVTSIDTVTQYMFIGILLLILLMLLFERFIFMKLALVNAKGKLSATDQLVVTELVAKIEKLRDEQTTADEETVKKLQRRIDSLQEQISKFKG